MELNREKVNLYLLKRGWNVSDLADHYGVTRQRMSILLNARRLTNKTIKRMADVFEVDPEELVIM